MPVFKASKIPKETVSSKDILAAFCYHFQQYKYEEAKKLPYPLILVMLRSAQKEQAKFMVDMLRVFSGSGSKKGHKNVLSYLEKIIKA